MASPLHFGPARVPSQESPQAAIELLLERGYTACELDFEGRFWMDYAFAERLGELAREHGIVLSVHAPIAGFMGHAERGKKLNMAVGMLDHSAGISEWSLEVVAAFMRAAYGKGYCDALTEEAPGSLCADHGYRVPARRATARADA